MTTANLSEIKSFPNGPISGGPVRKPNGQFATRDAINGVESVLLPNWKIGYRVGPHGRIYATREAAVRYAAWRGNYYGE